MTKAEILKEAGVVMLMEHDELHRELPDEEAALFKRFAKALAEEFQKWRDGNDAPSNEEGFL